MKGNNSPCRVCCSTRRVSFLVTSLLLLPVAAPAVAQLDAEFEFVALAGETPVPDGVGNFTGFSEYPAVDEDGNVVFTASGPNDADGQFQSGVYTAVGVCCQRVADRHTLIPGGGGATFYVFSGTERNDIEEGRVAFTARLSAFSLNYGLYSNVGQAGVTSLAEVALVDGVEWIDKGDPYIDGNVVSLRGRRLLPQDETTILLWNGATGARSYVNAGAGYDVSVNTQAPLSGDAVAFWRYSSGSSEMGVSVGGVYNALAVLNSTPMPGLDGEIFRSFRTFPVVDQSGLDVAFMGSSITVLGLFRRVDGEALENVADTSTLIPGTTAIPGLGDQFFNLFQDDGLSMADGQVVFQGLGPNGLDGIYTDIGGTLEVLIDDGENSTLVVDGQSWQVTGLSMGPKALALTPDGYTVVFKAWLSTGATAIVRAVIGGVEPPPTDTFTVYKDYSDNNPDLVSVSLICTSGTVTNSPQWAREGTPAVFSISGANANATCTATETSVASGYTKNESDCQNGDALNSSCTIVNTLNQTSNSFTVHKDFSDNNTSWVAIYLSCSSGTVTANPIWAREGTPAVFQVNGALPGTTCTATESSVPSGYTKNEADCQNGDPLGGSCTIVNTVTTASNTFTVFKDYSDNSSASVSVSASCSSGTVTNNPQSASEATPAIFNVSGASAGATCTAVENGTPAGYTKNQADCQTARPLNGSCVLVNTRIPTAQQQDVVYDGFEDGNANGWSTSGSVDVAGGTAIGQFALELSKSASAVYAASTSGYSSVTIEMRVAGSSLENGDACYAEYSTNGGSTWTTLVLVDSGDPDGTYFTGSASPAAASNNANLRLRFRSTGGQPNDTCWGDEVRVRGIPSVGSAGSFIVRKDFSDDNASSVSLSLACSSGTVTNSPRNASEAFPAIFYIQGQSSGATCSASENGVPSGYTANEAGCQDGDPVNGACTIVNTAGQTTNGTFTVNKDFSDNSTAAVTFTATCSSGTVTNSPRQATESSPAVFNVTGASAGTTCTAAEPSVPSGYTRNQSNCQSAKPLNGSCTIINTLNTTPQEVDILYSTFEDGQFGGWSTGANVAVDSTLAMGQYALHLENDGAISTRTISTVGYTGVNVSVRMAATSLEGSDVCRAEYSTNGGGTWSTLLELSNGGANGTFATATTATAAASNNPNFRLRFQMSGKGKGDHCHGDEIRVRGTP